MLYRFGPGVASIIGVVLLAGALLVIAQQPWVANHLGYALNGPRGLPFRLSYGSRHYTNEGTCAGDSWCQGSTGTPCTTTGWLKSYQYWPLQRVGSVVTLFGPAYPMLRASTPRGMTTMVLYVPVGQGCYLPYSLEGGP